MSRPRDLLFIHLALLPLSCEHPGDRGADAIDAVDVQLHAPILETAAAQASGRYGLDLRLDAHGSDPDGDAAGLALRLLDAGGAEIPLFDGDLDGFPDSGQTYVPFDVPVALSPEGFEAAATLLGTLGQGLEVRRVEIGLADGEGRVSNIITAELGEQPVRSLAESCDPTFVRDRCADDLGCKGTPASCQPGEPPALTQLAYFEPTDPLVEGPRLLLAGTEPDDDLRFLHLTLMDDAGTPVSIDLDGDDSPDGATFDVDATAAASGGRFFMELALSPGIQESIRRIAAFPEDRGGRVGAPLEATLGPVAVRTAGQACDPLGFDTCAAGATCATSAAGTSTCQAESAARSQQCAQAPLLTLTDGHSSFLGVADGTSLWDAPAGCSSSDPRGRPESIVLLRLGQDASRVVITTDTPNTNFDTTVYVVNPCNSPGSLAIVCGDDSAQTVATTLEMQAVPAGTYAIVIDSFGPLGGAFGLDVSVE